MAGYRHGAHLNRSRHPNGHRSRHLAADVESGPRASICRLGRAAWNVETPPYVAVRPGDADRRAVAPVEVHVSSIYCPIWLPRRRIFGRSRATHAVFRLSPAVRPVLSLRAMPAPTSGVWLPTPSTPAGHTCPGSGGIVPCVSRKSPRSSSACRPSPTAAPNGSSRISPTRSSSSGTTSRCLPAAIPRHGRGWCRSRSDRCGSTTPARTPSRITCASSRSWRGWPIASTSSTFTPASSTCRWRSVSARRRRRRCTAGSTSPTCGR